MALRTKFGQTVALAISIGLAAAMAVALPNVASAAVCSRPGQVPALGQPGAPQRTVTLTPPHTFGDSEFNGHGPAITVSAKREVMPSGNGDFIRVRVTMTAKETVSDWTTAAGMAVYQTYAAPLGCRIRNFYFENFDSNGYLNIGSSEAAYSLPAGNAPGVNNEFQKLSFVKGYKVWDDHSGSDAGTFTKVQVEFRDDAFTLY